MADKLRPNIKWISFVNCYICVAFDLNIIIFYVFSTTVGAFMIDNLNI